MYYNLSLIKCGYPTVTQEEELRHNSMLVEVINCTIIIDTNDIATSL